MINKDKLKPQFVAAMNAACAGELRSRYKGQTTWAEIRQKPVKGHEKCTLETSGEGVI